MPAIKCTQRSTICTFAVTSCGSATRGEDNRLTAASSMQPPCRCYGPKLLEAGGNCKWGSPDVDARSLHTVGAPASELAEKRSMDVKTCQGTDLSVPLRIENEQF